MLGSGRSNCNVTVKKNKIIKVYEDFAEKRYLNELNVYLYAKKKKLSYIPKLLDYDKTDYSHLTDNDYVNCIKDCNYSIKTLI